MKIFHIITQMEAGGAQGASVRNSRFFNELGEDSKVVFLYTKREVYHGCDIISLLDTVPSGIIDYLKILFRLYKLLKNNPGCKVICYTHYANVIGAFVGFLAGVKGVVISHRNPVQTYPKICKYVDFILGSLSFYSKSICVSNTVLDSFRNYPEVYKKKLCLVYNGINTTPLDEYSNLNEFEWIRKKSHGQYVLVCTGRLHPQKNQLMLIHAMKKVKNAILFIAGDGELHNAFKDEIKNLQLSEKVYLIGEIPPESVPKFLAVGDVFVFPSNYEAFGFSVVEAMAFGLPIICSDIPAMNEIVADAGIILNKDNPDLWSDAINEISEQKIKLMSENSIRRSKLFSLDNMASSYLRLVKDAN